MKIEKQSVEFLGETPTDEVGMFKLIERMSRICYQSKIQEDTWKTIPIKMYNSGHWAMLEHSNIAVVISRKFVSRLQNFLLFDIRALSFHNYSPLDENYVIMAGNITAWLNLINILCSYDMHYEHEYNDRIAFANLFLTSLSKYSIFNLHREKVLYLDMESEFHNNEKRRLEYDCNKSLPVVDNIPEKLKRYSFIIKTNRAISHEGVRHRVLSFAESSTRWIRYINKQGELVFIPTFEKLENTTNNSIIKKCVYDIYSQIDDLAGKLENKNGFNLKTDVIRGMYPNDLMTTLGITGDKAGLQHFVNLRDKKDAHFQIQNVGSKIKKHLNLN